MLIGSDPACTIHIDSLAVQPQHVELNTEDKITLLRDLNGPDGTFVNQKKVNDATLKEGDLIRIGKHTLTYFFEEVPEEVEQSMADLVIPEIDEPDPTPSVELNKKLGWLQIMSGQNLGKTMSLNRSMTNFGKPGVATACITRRDNGYYLSHLEGKYPPKIGKDEVSDSTRLTDGDTITIGNIKMQFYLE